MSCLVDSVIIVNEEILRKAYNIILEETKHNLLKHPMWKVVACAYLMGLDHGYAAHKEKVEGNL
jgi:hypothetical protein